MAIQVETNVPVPTRPGGGNAKYPWSDLGVGDSFFVAFPPKYFASTVSTEARKRGVKFIQRAIDGGVRIWRIA